MNYILRNILILMIFLLPTTALEAAKRPQVMIETNMGNIKVELFPRRAPGTVKNFQRYIKKKHYDETIFHRVIPGFMVQGGGFDTNFNQKPTKAPIRNESNNGLNNLTGTIAMARTDDFDSATAQFFINVNNNARLDATHHQLGYTVFGEVIEGMEVALKIAEVPTRNVMGLGEDVPVNPIIIHSIRMIDTKSKADEKKSAPSDNSAAADKKEDTK